MSPFGISGSYNRLLACSPACLRAAEWSAAVDGWTVEIPGPADPIPRRTTLDRLVQTLLQ
ncbi:hypothetical protein [Nocardia carnea]|uniref:hypothetical protein n=1 Tax=Nocardia carnea TaxID=37328 RepID=UPI002454E570|nr:hypothetical protein [Nocardia carnea]